MLAEIFLAHAIGDYIIQNHWMATEKTKRWWPAVVHGATYTIPFVFITQSPLALFVIFSTHVLIDHWRLARYVMWLKNQAAPQSHRYPFEGVAAQTGFPADTPMWLSMWLMIIADNVLHILINTAAVYWL